MSYLRPYRKTVHIIVGAEGNTGKTVLARAMAGYLRGFGRESLIIHDSDPDYFGYFIVEDFEDAILPFKHHYLELLTRLNKKHQPNPFPEERINEIKQLVAKHDGDVIFDISADGFRDFLRFNLQAQLVPFLETNGSRTLVHTVIFDSYPHTQTLDMVFNLQLPVIIWKSGLYPQTNEIEQSLAVEDWENEGKIAAVNDMPKAEAANIETLACAEGNGFLYHDRAEATSHSDVDADRLEAFVLAINRTFDLMQPPLRA